MTYREAGENDIPALAALRFRQLVDEGLSPQRDITPELLDFFGRKLASGELTQLVAEEDGVIVGTGAVIMFEFPPNFKNPHCLGAYVTNMYTALKFRRHGIAAEILKRLERIAREAGVSRLWLGAPEDGGPIYEKHGFVRDGRQMKLELDGE